MKNIILYLVLLLCFIASFVLVLILDSTVWKISSLASSFLIQWHDSPLTNQHIIDRIDYYKTILINGMQPIVFTDENTVVVDLSGSGIWRQRGFHSANSFYTKDHHPMHVMVWEAIGSRGFWTDLISCPYPWMPKVIVNFQNRSIDGLQVPDSF